MQIVKKTVGDHLLKLRQSACRLYRDETGATAIEYGLIAGLLSIVLVSSIGLVGTTMRDGYFNTVSTAMNDALASAGF